MRILTRTGGLDLHSKFKRGTGIRTTLHHNGLPDGDLAATSCRRTLCKSWRGLWNTKIEGRGRHLVSPCGPIVVDLSYFRAIEAVPDSAPVTTVQNHEAKRLNTDGRHDYGVSGFEAKSSEMVHSPVPIG